MAKTLKQLCDAAREELGWDIPALYASATDADGKQSFRLAIRQGFDMMNEPVVWQALKTEATITLVAADQDYDLPTDFNYLLPATEWDQNNDRRLSGPLSARAWAEAEHGGTVFGLNWRYEIRGDQIVFNQTVEAGDAGTLISYEYSSKNWVRDSSNVSKMVFSEDTDTQVFDDDLFISGLVWRFKRSKGFDWQSDYAFYENWLNQYKSRDGGSKDTFFLNDTRSVLGVNIPETGYGS